MAERINLAPGFRFYPNDQELITCYLKPKILGQKLACNIINDIELYGPNSTPWQLFNVNDHDSWTDSPDKLTDKYLYVFTTLSKLRVSENTKKRCIRENTCKKAGCGTWNAKTKRKVIRDCDGNVIGQQRMLLFEINDVGGQFDVSKAGHFRMHEYSLGGINKGLKSAGGGDVVLCKITFDSSKSPVFNLGSKSTDHVLTNSDHVLTNRGEGQEIEQNKNKEEKVERTLTSVVVADNVERAECLSLENCLQEADEFGWDSSFTDWFMGLINFDEEEGVIEDVSKLGKRKFEEENLYSCKKICL